VRDRLLGSRRFQRFAVANPITRPIARARARQLFDLCAGFVYSQVLSACVQLQLFETLADGPVDRDELSARLDLPGPALDRLIAAATALELTEARSDGAIGLGSLGAALLGNPGITAMVQHHALLYADLRDPVALLRGDTPATALGDYWSYTDPAAATQLTAEDVLDYSALMAASQPLIADEVLSVYSLASHQRLLDVGGGIGVFMTAALERYPQLTGMLFDLPAVAVHARERLAAAGLAGRVNVTGGSFFDDPLPTGADVATLVRVLFDHPDERVEIILTSVHAALPAGGTVVVAEPMAGTRGAEPSGDAYFGFYLLAMGHGRARTPERITELLHGAGFHDVRLRRGRLPMNTRVITASR
ncbi:MAG: methyltransferase, partial [Gammaproteobacteria bacterium]|nr:methyltransferase [Gammaproteobacteria bacterium]